MADDQPIPGLVPSSLTPEQVNSTAEPLVAPPPPAANAADAVMTEQEPAAPTEAVVGVQDSSEPHEDVFKVPAVPKTLHGLPADIEHILSLGANDKDEGEDANGGSAGQTNYEQVVRDLKEKAGFGEIKMEDGGESHDGLEGIEKEMEAGGITREGAVEESVEIKQEEEVHAEEMNAESTPSTASAVKMDVEDTADSSSSDSSSSDSSSSDSDDDPSPRATASSTTTDSTFAAGPDGKKKRVRRRPQRNRAASPDSDMSDDDVNSGAVGGAPKTEHELDQPDIELPKIDKVPEGVELATFGKVQSVIETVVVIKADTAGSYKVLDEGTVCCLEDRTVVGSIFETFGSVQQPFYSLRFPVTALPSPEVFTTGRAIFYAPTLASFVFTRELRAMKGSDASNVWDEEVGAAEIEFSDDEEEQEYKRAQKAERRSRTASATPGPSGRGSSRASSTQPRPPPAGPPSSLPARPSTLSYADVDAPDSTALGPMAPPQRDLWSMGEKPPPGREGRRMFERDTGRDVAGEVEFEFSDGEESVGGRNESADRPAIAVGRGRGARGRGEGRGRGRGADRGRGGRGGRAGPPGVSASGRPVAGLPRGLAGLPQRPSFEAPPTEDERRGSSGADGISPAPSPMAPPPALASAAAPLRMTSPPPQLRSSAPALPAPTAHSSFAFSGSEPPPQFFGAAPPSRQQQPAYASHPGDRGQGFSGPSLYPQPPQPYPQQYPQHDAYGQQQQQQPYHPAGPIPVQGGHFNPRFYAQGALSPGGGPPQHQLGAYPAHQPQQYAPQGYGASRPQQEQYWQGQQGQGGYDGGYSGWQGQTGQ